MCLAILPGRFASVRTRNRESNTALLSPHVAGSTFRYRVSYLPTGVTSDVPGDPCWYLGVRWGGRCAHCLVRKMGR